MELDDKTRGNLQMFEEDLTVLINKYSLENLSNTPDFILANYLVHCLRTFGATVNARTKWYDGK